MGNSLRVQTSCFSFKHVRQDTTSEQRATHTDEGYFSYQVCKLRIAAPTHTSLVVILQTPDPTAAQRAAVENRILNGKQSISSSSDFEFDLSMISAATVNEPDQLMHRYMMPYSNSNKPDQLMHRYMLPYSNSNEPDQFMNRYMLPYSNSNEPDQFMNRYAAV